MAIGVVGRATAQLLGYKSLLKAFHPGVGRIKGATSVTRVTRTQGDKVLDTLRIRGGQSRLPTAKDPATGQRLRGQKAFGDTNVLEVPVPRTVAEFDRMTPAQRAALGGKRTRRQLEKGPLPDDWRVPFAEDPGQGFMGRRYTQGLGVAGLGTFGAVSIPEMMEEGRQRRFEEQDAFNFNVIEAVGRAEQERQLQEARRQNYGLLRQVDPRLAASLYAGTMLPEGSVAIGMGRDRGAILSEMLNAMNGPQQGMGQGGF